MRRPRAPRVVIDVDQTTIEEAVKGDSSHCMIAEAIRKSIPGATRVSVDIQTVRFSDPKRRLRYTYLTPRRAQVALIEFDSGKAPAPFAVGLTNGQVTPMSAGTKPPEKAERDRQRQREIRVRDRELATAKLEAPDAGGTTTGVPRRSGGTPPPLMPFARRRAYGLRALERDLTGTE